MLIDDSQVVDIASPTGPMRMYIFRPTGQARYPGVVFYSEIFQVTGPIRRAAAFLAGHGYIVAVPEIYHELEPAGTVLAYDTAGADTGNAHKTTKPVSAYDSDARAALDHLKARADCSGRLGVIGICIGGHLAFRAAKDSMFDWKTFREIAHGHERLAVGLGSLHSLDHPDAIAVAPQFSGFDTAASIARLFPPAKPRFTGDSSSFTDGNRSPITRTESSVDPLSHTITCFRAAS